MKNNISIVGMGYVGLTLAGSCLSVGHNVVGVEINETIRNTINKGKAHFHEPGLDEILTEAVNKNKLHCIHPEEHKNLVNCEIFIITVGTPLISGTETPNLDYIKSALNTIIPYLDKDKLVILRSTVLVGLTRSEVIPYILKNSDLTIEDINICFAPERTVEGNAMSELKNLPQIVGYNNSIAKKLAGHFFSTYVREIKLVNSIEAAELVKLFNNVYRDLNFSIGNAFNDIAKYYNLNGYEVIEAANFNYDRSNIALPGFVGGPCLEKDSYILCNNLDNDKLTDFILNGRKFNESQEDKVTEWITNNFKLKDRIILTGMAFKGVPDTGDLRGSSSVKIYQKLKRKGFSHIYIHDFIVEEKELKEIGSDKVIIDIKNTRKDFKLVAILNNNTRYKDKEFIDLIEKKSEQILDIWNITKLPNIKTIGNI